MRFFVGKNRVNARFSRAVLICVFNKANRAGNRDKPDIGGREMLMKGLKSTVWALAPALAFAVAQPAVARDGYRHDRRGGDDAAIAIGAGVVGLALGAAIASSGRDRDRDYYYDDGYYNDDGYYPRQSYYYRVQPRYYAYPAYGYPRGYRRDWRGPRAGYRWRHHHRNWRY